MVKQQSLGINRKNYLPYRVIIAGGTKQDRENLIRVLVRKEFSIVSSVNDGKEALEELERMSEKPDLLFVDYAVHTVTGTTSIKKIRDLYPQIKTVVTGNHPNKELVKELVQLKVHSFILKPFDDLMITEKLAHLLGRKDLVPKKEIVYYKHSVIDLKDLKVPAIPSVIMSVLRVNTDDPEVGSKELEKIISPDKAISSNVIRLANSAYYGRSGSIHTLKEAITLLGIQTIKNLVFLQGKKNLSSNIKGKSCEKFLNEFPILTALIAFDLSNPLNLKSIGESLFLYSLLSRIGMIVLGINFPQNYTEVLKFYEFGVKSLVELETEMLTVDSTSLGLKVFRLWQMPDGFMEVVENQNFTENEVEAVSDISRVIKLAEIFALKLMGVALKEEELKLEQLILEKYNKTEIIELFNEDYYELIKEHPLYILALT